MHPSSSAQKGRHGQNVFDRVMQSFQNARLNISKKSLRMLCLAACLIAASIAARAQDCSIVVDGTDQAAIQSALDMAVGPCVVIIPPGRYQIEGTLLGALEEGVTRRELNDFGCPDKSRCGLIFHSCFSFLEFLRISDFGLTRTLPALMSSSRK